MIEDVLVTQLIVGNLFDIRKEDESLLVSGFERVATLNKVSGAEKPQEILQKAWQEILGKDYSPVYEPALAVLHQLPDRRFSKHVLLSLVELANRIADSISELGYDHAGPLYRRILPKQIADADGAYYTNNLSALMLARLALNKQFTDWKNLEIIRKLRIIDPACGTGTLLMAALHTIKARFEQMQATTEVEKPQLHKILVEEVLCSLDINRHAVQLAACNLTLGAPTVDYKRMNLFTLKHGPQEDGSMRSGSVELISTANQSDSLQAFVRPLRTMDHLQSEQVNKEIDLEFPLKNCDLVIMNPPYTNNTKRNRQFSKEEVKLMQQHELFLRDQYVSENPDSARVINSNSVSTFFTPVADKLLRKEGGVLAKVLPVTACTGASGLAERKFLANRFHIEFVITSHDPKKINFSENTSIHECLLVARRKSNAQQATKFVSLRIMPTNPEQAIAVAEAIAKCGEDGSFDWGSEVSWPSDLIEAGSWTPVQWFSSELAYEAHYIETLNLLEPAGVRQNIGPDPRGISGAFQRSTAKDQDSKPVFWSISSNIRQTMYATPDAWYCAKASKRKLAQKYWRQRSHVLVAKRYNTVSSRLTALWSPKATVGLGWIPVKIENVERAKALVAWWNSTPARLMLLNQRSRTLTYSPWSLKQLRSIGIPKPSNSAWSDLADAWRETHKMKILPLREGDNCKVRRIIDRAAAKALHVEEDRVANWRRLLAKEPTISNRRAEI